MGDYKLPRKQLALLNSKVKLYDHDNLRDMLSEYEQEQTGTSTLLSRSPRKCVS